MNVRKLTLAAALTVAAGSVFAQSPAPYAAPAGPAVAACASAPCGPGESRGPGMHRHGGHHRGHHGAMLRFLDTDRDGQVSRTELQAGQQRQMEMFDKADSDGDGKLSPEEMRAARAQWRGFAAGSPEMGGPCTLGPKPEVPAPAATPRG